MLFPVRKFFQTVLGVLTLATVHASQESTLETLIDAPDQFLNDTIQDAAGNRWAVINRKLGLWKNNTFTELNPPILIADYFTEFLGDSAHGIYLIGDRTIHRLENGQPTLVTTLEKAYVNGSLQIHVAADGRLFHWDAHFLEVFESGQWKRSELQPPYPAQLWRMRTFEASGSVYFLAQGFLYSMAEGNRLHFHPLPKRVQGQAFTGGTVWKEKNIVICAEGKLSAFEITTGDQVDLPMNMEPPPEFLWSSAFPLRDGRVCLVCTNKLSSQLFLLAHDGQLTRFGSNIPANLADAKFIEGRNGNFVFLTSNQGLMVVRNGSAQRWGFNVGIARNLRNAREDASGDIWLTSFHAVQRLNLGINPPATNPKSQYWDEVLLRGPDLWELGDGKLAALKADAPEHLSIWDGKTWVKRDDFNLPMNTRIHCVDDRGHLLAGTDYIPEEKCGEQLDIGPNFVKRYASFDELLVGAVKDGATRFNSGALSSFPSSIVVSKSGQLWHTCNLPFGKIRHFDGNWNDVRPAYGGNRVIPSAQYGAIFLNGNRPYATDTNRWFELPAPIRERTVNGNSEKSEAYMLGPLGLQPYEKATVETSAGTFVPLLRVVPTNGTRDQWYFAQNAQRFEHAWSNPAFPDPTLLLPLPLGTNPPQRVYPARSGGFWLYGDFGVGRVFGDCMQTLPRDSPGTPLEGREMDVHEDAAGDLWFAMLQSNQQPDLSRAFRCRLSNVALQIPDIPRLCGRQLKVDVNCQAAPGKIRLLSKINNGPWRACPEDATACEFNFPTTGEYTCQITGLCLTGRLKELSFQVEATVREPQTVATEDNAHVKLAAFHWKPSAYAKPSAEGTKATLAWRIQGEEWKALQVDGSIDCSSLKPGTYTFEIAAAENDVRDSSPLVFTVDLRPDYDALVEPLILDLTNNDYEKAQRANKMIRGWGEPAIEALDRKRRAAQKQAAPAAELNAIFKNLETQPSSKP